jgi:hypothetical protein
MHTEIAIPLEEILCPAHIHSSLWYSPSTRQNWRNSFITRPSVTYIVELETIKDYLTCHRASDYQQEKIAEPQCFQQPTKSKGLFQSIKFSHDLTEWGTWGGVIDQLHSTHWVIESYLMDFTLRTLLLWVLSTTHHRLTLQWTVRWDRRTGQQYMVKQ